MKNYGGTKHAYKNKTKRFPTYQCSPTTCLDPVNQCQIIRISLILFFDLFFYHDLFHLNYD